MSEVMEPDTEASQVSDAETNLWNVQIGPIVGGGTTLGYVNSFEAYFNLATPDGLYTAAASIDGGANWVPIPGNQGFTIGGGSNRVQWRLTGPTGGTCKFMIGALPG